MIETETKKPRTSSAANKRFIDKTYKRYGLSFRKVDDRIYIDYIENTRDELNITPTDIIRRLIDKELYKK